MDGDQSQMKSAAYDLQQEWSFALYQGNDSRFRQICVAQFCSKHLIEQLVLPESLGLDSNTEDSCPCKVSSES